MRIITASFFLALISFTMACPSSKPVAPVNDASDGAAALDGVTITTTICHEAAVRLQQLNCPEGDAPQQPADSFERVCLHAQRTHAFDLHPECIAHAVDVQNLREACNMKCAR